MLYKPEKVVHRQVLHVKNSRSIVLAPTVMIQGATLVTEPEKGPEFPAEQTTTI